LRTDVAAALYGRLVRCEREANSIDLILIQLRFAIDKNRTIANLVSYLS